MKKGCRFCKNAKTCKAVVGGMFTTKEDFELLSCCNKMIYNFVPNDIQRLFDEIYWVFNIIQNNLNSTIFSSDTTTIIPHCRGVSQVLSAAQNTLTSILLVVNNGSFADAFTMIRKLYDDLILSLFILKQHLNKKEIISKWSLENNIKLLNESLIDNFIAGKLLDKNGNNIYADFETKKFFAELVGKNLKDEAIGAKTNLTECYERFFEKDMQKLNRYLNNNVHSNGLQFIENNIDASDKYLKDEQRYLQSKFNDVKAIIKYVVNIFVSFIILMQPNCIMSSDYIDCLYCNILPEGNLQYWVAPGIQDYITKHMSKELKEFLRKNNSYGMEIED